MKAKLILENGEQFAGLSFGYEQPVAGEVVFNTAMCGYSESITNPSCAGEIIVFTYPLIGNCGTPSEKLDGNGLSQVFESEKIHAKALIVSDYSENYSHWNACDSLSSWLKQQKIPALTNIDTRALAKILRDSGSMSGKIVFESDEHASTVYNSENENLAAQVSCSRVIRYNSGGSCKIVLVDCGVQHSILHDLLKRNVEIIRVPWNYDFTEMDFDGLFISNGPGNPARCTETVDNIRKLLDRCKPVFGTGMGNQLLALAGGAKTYKLKYGHRSNNQPVQMLTNGRCFVTSQNHGYAVENATLNDEWKPLFINLNDGTNEGICHQTKPFFSVEFHSVETEFLLDDFLKKVEETKN